MNGPLPPTAAVAVIGAGAMGAGIAQIAAQAGHRVQLLDARPGAAAQAIGVIRATFAKLADKGKISAEAASASGDRLVEAASSKELAGCALVVEAVVEQIEVKRVLFAELEAIVGADCILATNTSSISVTAIAAGLQHPGRLVGMHFFNPAPLMALVEVVSGLATEPEVAAVVHATALAWGKLPVHTRSTPGFIVNRCARPFYAEALRLVTEGAGDPTTLDAVMRESGGFRMGPFELMDLIGHDVNFAVTRSVFDAFFGDPKFTPSLVQQEMVSAGFHGRKSGRGFYDHAPGAVRPVPATEPPAALTSPVELWVGEPLGQILATRLETVGVPFASHNAAHEDGRFLRVGDARIYVTDGRSATQRGADNAQPDTVLVDLTFDAATAPRLAVSRGDRCNNRAFVDAVAVFQAAGFQVSHLADVPGLMVMRTVAMLANEAADAVHQGVCDATGVDTAMQKGVNYPRGPLAWADVIGPSRVLAVLDHLAQVYGEDRYRASPLLRRRVAAVQDFHTRSEPA